MPAGPENVGHNGEDGLSQSCRTNFPPYLHRPVPSPGSWLAALLTTEPGLPGARHADPVSAVLDYGRDLRFRAAEQANGG
jgi:hypothetical protein